MNAISTDQSAVQVFLKSWRVYQDIIRNNYMYHREISDAVRAALESYRANDQFRILDLGSGDGSMTLPLISANRIDAYIGCDLSKPALDIAEEQIKTLGISAQLICDDMLKVVSEQPDHSADLVYSSYAIHHLNTPQKQQMVGEIARVLAPGGLFVLIDIFLEPDEDRAAYMRHYMGRLKETWTALSSEAQDLIVNHATTYDFPEHPEFYGKLLGKHGFSNASLLAKHTWHEAWCFTNPMH
ncbi:MAG: class I SAM-dependent methyltransferase [Fluviibacter sp.]